MNQAVDGDLNHAQYGGQTRTHVHFSIWNQLEQAWVMWSNHRWMNWSERLGSCLILGSDWILTTKLTNCTPNVSKILIVFPKISSHDFDDKLKCSPQECDAHSRLEAAKAKKFYACWCCDRSYFWCIAFDFRNQVSERFWNIWKKFI